MAFCCVNILDIGKALGAQQFLRACLAGLGLNSCSSLTVTPVFELRRVVVRMHRSTIINQLKSCEARLNAVIFIGGRLRKRNSAKQAREASKEKPLPRTPV